jgi:cycloeucalenol cycloisomerase
MATFTSLIEVVEFAATDASLQQIYAVIGALCLLLVSLSVFLRRKGPGTWLPSKEAAPAKRACEIWFLGYGVFWIACFAVIIALRLYDDWGREAYAIVLGGLMSPLILQPLLLPWLTCDQGKALMERYSFKANLWMLIFGFIGNYWYTHYFYNVLKATYTMQSWDLNGVPIPMFFATHFYFCFYHTLSNMALRKTATRYEADRVRWWFTVVLICVMSYITAFMEALTISGYSCYKFADRHMAWVYGSAFYGIYFLVSYPMYLRLDEPSADTPAPSCPFSLQTPTADARSKSRRASSPRREGEGGGGGGGKATASQSQESSSAAIRASSYKHFSAFDTIVESLASGMAVLLMLGTNNSVQYY